MGYRVGIDLGTTWTAAALWRDGRTEPVTLGMASTTIPTVVWLREDGDLAVGEQAVRNATREPTRVARDFKRRLGDPTPLVLGTTPFSVESLMAAVLRWVVATIAEREGQPPERVVLTHPASYGPYKVAALAEVSRLAGLPSALVELLAEPTAAAISYSARQRVEPGAVIAVYDFGGGTFDAAVLRRTPTGFEILGEPDGVERLGGVDVDAALLHLVDDRMGGPLTDLDPSDAAAIGAAARLREECRIAKEALSGEREATVEAIIPGHPPFTTALRRADLTTLLQPRLRETTDSLERAVSSAGLSWDQVSRVLLVGGSSRLPGVAEAVQQATGRPVALDAHPKLAIALGAAAYAGRDAGQPIDPPGAVAPAAETPAATALHTTQPSRAPSTTPEPIGTRRRWLIGAVGALVALGAAAVAVLTRDDGSTTTAPSISPTVQATTPPPTAPVVAVTTASTEPRLTAPSPTTPSATTPATAPSIAPLTTPATDPPTPTSPPTAPPVSVAAAPAETTIGASAPAATLDPAPAVAAVKELSAAAAPFDQQRATCPIELDPRTYLPLAPPGLIADPGTQTPTVLANAGTPTDAPIVSCQLETLNLTVENSGSAAELIDFMVTPQPGVTNSDVQRVPDRGGEIVALCRTAADRQPDCRVGWVTDGFNATFTVLQTVSSARMVEWMAAAIPSILDGLTRADPTRFAAAP